MLVKGVPEQNESLQKRMEILWNEPYHTHKEIYGSVGPEANNYSCHCSEFLMKLFYCVGLS